MQFITNLDKTKIRMFKNKLITEKVILIDERLYNHILLSHGKDYKQLKPYLKTIIENPNYIILDNRHQNTLMYLKYIHEIEIYGRVVIKLALMQYGVGNKNSIITLMKLNIRTWNQTIKNRGEIIWKNIDKNE